MIPARPGRGLRGRPCENGGMMRKMKRVRMGLLGAMMVLALVAVTGCDTGGLGKPERIEIGKPMPDFTLKDAAGKEWQLSSLRGKVVLVNFWATWCQPCRDELPSLVALNKTMAGKEFQMLAVAFNDDVDMADSFAKRYGGTFPVLGNPPEDLIKAYMITGVPETFIVDPQGILRYKLIGPYEWDSPDMLKIITGFMGSPQ